MRSLGTRIRQAREAKGLSQDQLGDAVGPVTREAVSLWEADKTRPRDHRLEQIAAVLAVSYEWLRTGKEPPDSATLAQEAAAILAQAGKVATPARIIELTNIIKKLEAKHPDIADEELEKITNHLARLLARD